MLNIVTEWKKVEIELNGEIITCEVKPLTSNQMLLILPLINDIEKTDDPFEMSKRNLNLQQSAAVLFPEIVRNIEGILVDNKPVTSQQLSELSSLCNLSNFIISHAIQLSKIDSQSEKN